MRKIKKIFSLMLALMMFCGCLNHPMQAQAAGNTAAYLNELISYYQNYQEKATTDIERVLGELKSVDETAYEDWKEIMDYWSYVNTEMPVNSGVAPDGLPEDDSLAIVVLGFALNDDGTMKDELIGRLQVGLASAQKYPNSYIVCTGGGTAANNTEVTEGGLMGDWLIEQGLDESRVIVEDKAPDTVGNALNTYNILVKEYPQVESVCLITSDYHVPRGCLLFNSKFILAATAAGTKPLNIAANAGYDTGSEGYETIALQGRGLASVAGITLSGSVKLSNVTYLDIALKEAYQTGAELNMTVTAGYDSGYTKDVTDKVTVEGFDASLGADQTVTVSYTENDVTISGSFTLSEMNKTIVATGHLESLITEAEGLDADAYSADTIAVLNEKITAAKAVLASGTYTAEEIAAAYAGLQEAYEGLLKIMNAAYLKNVTASCNQDEAYKLVNGSASDYWTSKDSSGDVAIADSYFVIDLDGEYELDNIHVTPYYGNDRYYHYDVQISTDGETWETVAEHRSTDACTSAGNVHEMEEGTYARYVKVAGVAVYRPDKTIINFHVKEVAVYGIESDNIALGKKVISSGTDLSAASSASSSERKINDGDRATYWDGGAYKNRPWIAVALGDVYKLDRVNVINYWNGSSRYYQYEVYTSIDGENYTLLGVKDDTAAAAMAGETYTCTEDVYAAYIKVVGTYNSKNSAFHLNEVRAYGEIADEESYKEYQYKEAKNALANLVAEYEADHQAADYTKETWAVYEAAVNSAKALLEAGDSQIEDIYAEINSLKAAEEQLEYFVVEKAEGVYRLASTNIYAKGNTDVKGVLEQFYDRYDIDYAGLQEVDRNTTRNPYDMMEAFTTDTRFVDFAFNKNMDYAGGEYGIGILSTTEIKEKSGGLYEVLGSEEQRGWLRTVIEIDGKEVAFYDTHLSTDDDACLSNMKEIIKLMDEDPLEYKILTADFNCNREWMYPFLVNYNMANGKDGLWYATSGDDYTDIASSEAYGLDNIITSRNIEVLDFKVVDSEDLSDHNFIYIDFKLLDEEVPSKEYLNIEVTDAKKLEASDYTEESYAVLENALKAAEALADTASQKEINSVLFDVQNAAESLVRIEPLISEGKPITVNGEISEGKVEDITDGYMLSFIKTTYNSDIIMDLEGLYHIDELQVFDFGKAPRTHHYELYTSIDGVNYELYAEKKTDEIASIKTGQVFEKEDCIARYVKIVMTYNSTSEDHVYLSELEVYGSAAESASEYKEALGTLIENYSQLNSEDYVAFSYEAMVNELAKAKAVYEDADASDADVKAAYEALMEVYDAMEPAPDKSELQALIASCESKNLEEYSARTVANLNEKIADAKAVCDDANALQADVDAAADALNDAVKLLAAPVNAAYKMELTTTENTVMVTLDGVYGLDEIVVVTAYDGASFYNYDVLVSEDGESWTKAAEQTGDVIAPEEGYVHEVDNTVKVKYIKLESAAALNVSEIYAYGEECNNIALGKPVSFGNSSTETAPLVINDGNRANYWEAGKYAKQPWAVIDLEGLYQLDSINVITYWSRNDRYYNYKVYVSEDGENYTLFADRDSTDITTVYGDTFAAEEEVTARYIKIEGYYNSKNSVFHLNEVRAYGELIAEPEPPVVEEDEVVRVSGKTRYETGYKVADELKAVLGVDKFEAVVVATGKNFADALAGSYLAVEKNAPILLTNGKADSIAALHDYIKANVAEGGKVYILGGEAAVPAEAAAIDGYDVVRLSGKSRYETNLAILNEAGVAGDAVIVATGKAFADSLSASAAKLPILLVKPGTALNDEQKAIVEGKKDIYIIGGTGAVSEEVAEELAAFGTVTRVSGKTRYETSVAVANTFFADVDAAVVANGKNFPDGLCGGPLAAALDCPLILTTDGKTAAAEGYMAENTIADGFVLGGTGALSDEAVVDIFALENAEEIK